MKDRFLLALLMVSVPVSAVRPGVALLDGLRARSWTPKGHGAQRIPNPFSEGVQECNSWTNGPSNSWTNGLSNSLTNGPGNSRRNGATLSGLVARYNFDESSGSVVRDLSGNENDGTLRGGAARSPGLLQGGVQLEGADGCVEIPDSPSLHLREGLTISLWVRPGRIMQDPAQKGDCQALVSKNWNWRSRIDHRGRLATILGGENWEASKQEMQWVLPAEKDVWCHVVYVFSRDEKRMRLYRDGQKIDERAHVIDGLRDERGQPLLLGLDAGDWNPLLGCMDEVQVYNRALTEEEIAALPVSVSPETLLSWDMALERSRTQLRRSVSSHKTDRDLATRIERKIAVARKWIAGEKGGETRDLLTAKFCQFSALLERIEGTTAALAQGRAPLKRAVAYAVTPVTAALRLPNSFPAERTASDTFHLVAAPGEFEPVSFVLAAWDELRRLTFRVGDLRGNAGSLPAASVDLRVVKCWYQAGSAWQDVFQDRQHRVLVPELLLHDDSLVTVDEERHENHVRCSFSGGERYVCVSGIPTGPGNDDPAAMQEARGRTIPNRVFPVQDRASLQPLDIQEGTCRQFWLTVHVPETARPGDYSGTVEVAAAGRSLGRLRLKVRVLPFRLAQPARRDDLRQPFISSVYNMTVLSDSGDGSLTPTGRSEAQLRAELRNLRDHGVTCPTDYQLNWDYSIERLEKALKIRDELDMSREALLLLGKEGNQGAGMDASPASLDQLRAKVRELLAVARRWGYKDLYLYGIDEAPREMLSPQRPVWKAVHEAGAKVFVSGAGLNRPESYPDMYREMGDLLDFVVSSGSTSRAEADRWHAAGHRIASYGNPQSGLENPDLYRRNFGLGLWLCNYDSAMTFIYYGDFGNPWNDFDHPVYRDHNFVYPTVDGVVDTIAWEGYREGMDDLRYATTLKLAIEAGKQSGRPDILERANQAERWLETLDVSRADLDDVRRKMIDHTLRLQTATFRKR